MNPELIVFWLAVALYGLSSFCYIFGLFANNDKLFSIGRLSAGAGFASNIAAVAIRWIGSGVLPFVETSESLASGVLIAVLIFLVAQFTIRNIRPLGVLIMPVAFVLMGWAGTLMKEIAPGLAPAMQSWWLWVHIVGASTGFGAVLTAAALGLMYLLKEKGAGGIHEKLPEIPVLDNLSYRFIAGGFIMLGLMIISGAFWSNQVKGNYWNWDPVEVWSLISWLVYAIYLHLRLTMGWRARRLAVYALLALPVMIISYWGVPFAVETFHAGFRIEH